MIGPVLVLATWFVAVLALAAIGLAPALVATRGVLTPRVLRSALWWGLLIATIVILATNIWLPLRSGSAAIVFAIVVVLIAVIGIWLIKRRRQPGCPSESAAGGGCCHCLSQSRWQWFILRLLQWGLSPITTAAFITSVRLSIPVSSRLSQV